MGSIRLILICATSLLLVICSESLFWEDLEIADCNALFGVICPALNPRGVTCAVGQIKLCQRNLDENKVLIPFSDNFDEYDKNSDGFITFTEFLDAVTSAVNLSDPEELMTPFGDSDTNGDNQLDSEEFVNSDLLFPGEPEKYNGVGEQSSFGSPTAAEYNKSNQGFITVGENWAHSEGTGNLIPNTF